MPIPIPIPMPVGPSGGKYHSHQQHHSDDEGEVKKIYLLQPMPRIQPQPQLKGGGGLTQTHIHLPAPMMHNANKPARHSSYMTTMKNSHSYESANNDGGNYDYDSSDKSSSNNKGSSGVKILPIVVIPPVAPIPPIHIAPPSPNGYQNNPNSPRMMLKPQFNNYLVTAGDMGDRRHPALMQDHKSFSDYGDAMYGSSRSRLRSRYPGRPISDTVHGHRMGRSRSRSRLHDLHWADSDYDFEPSMRSRAGSRRQWASGRQRMYSDGSRRMPYRISSNSIRDILDQQVLFDEDPSGLEAGESARAERAECCHENGPRHRQQQTYAAGTAYTDNNLANSNLDQTDSSAAAAAGRDFVDDHHQRGGLAGGEVKPSVHRQMESLDDGFGGASDQRDQMDHQNKQVTDPSSFNQYDREPLSDRHRSRGISAAKSSIGLSGHDINNNYAIPSSSKRLYSDAREIFDADDEWRFDSIKSVKHTNPSNSIATTRTTTNATIITTTVPPNIAKNGV